MAATERDIRRRSFAMRSVQADTYAEDPVQSELYPAGLSKRSMDQGLGQLLLLSRSRGCQWLLAIALREAFLSSSRPLSQTATFTRLRDASIHAVTPFIWRRNRPPKRSPISHPVRAVPTAAACPSCHRSKAEPLAVCRQSLYAAGAPSLQTPTYTCLGAV